MFGAVTKALNIAYDVDETYGFLRRTLVEVGMLLTIGIFFIIAVASRYVIRFLQGVAAVLPTGETTFVAVLTTVVPSLLLVAAFFLVYRFVPRRRPSWGPALVGAVLATILLSLARPLFAYYVNRFTNYNLVYGSLAVAIIGVLWAWIGAVILIFGGEVVAHVQFILVQGLSPEEVERRHHERSPTRKD